MYAKLISTFILFSLASAMTESEVSEHAKFADEYHKVLRQTLSESSQVFESLNYDIKDGKFNMQWAHHKKVPTLQFDFDVIINEQQVCHLSFKLESHLSHVPQAMKEEDNESLVQEIRKCGEKILGQNEPVTNLTDEVLSDFEQHLEESISDESRKSVESALQNKLDQSQNNNRQNIDLVSDTESNEEESLLSKFFKNVKPSSEDDVLNMDVPVLQKRQGYYPGYKTTCTPHVKEVIKTHLRNLVFQNLVQDIKVFDENIKNCIYQNQNSQHIYDSILQFNRERCFLRTKLVNGQIQIMTNEYQESKFLLDLDTQDMTNCADRFATIELLTK